ncbi:hypothetical protein PHYSODRAFT_410267, partial [Phytophthora sojae]
WKISSAWSSHTVNDLDWTCTCNFYSSTNLPCKHIMLIAQNGQRFDFLPPSVVHQRW